MKVTIPKQVLEACDVCKQTHNAIGKVCLTKCIFCGNKFCLSCKHDYMNCYAFDICKTCGKTNGEVSKFIYKTRDHWNKDRMKFIENLKNKNGHINWDKKISEKDRRNLKEYVKPKNTDMDTSSVDLGKTMKRLGKKLFV